MIRFDDLPSGSNPVAPLSFDDLPDAAKPATGLSAIADAAKLMGKATLAPITAPLAATKFLAEDPENGRALLASNVAGLVAAWKGAKQYDTENYAAALRAASPRVTGAIDRIGGDVGKLEAAAQEADAVARGYADEYGVAAGARREAGEQLGINERPTDPTQLPGYWLKTAGANLAPTFAGVAGTLAAGPLAGGAIMGATVFGDTFGAKRAEGVGMEQATRAAGVSAIIEGGSEALGLSAITGRLAKVLGDAKLADTFVGRLATKLEATTGGRLVEGTVGEGFTEALSSAAQDIYEAGEFNRQIDWPQFRNNIIDAFMVGGITGGPLAGGVEMARPKQPAPPIQQRENLLTGGTVAAPVIAPRQQAVQPEAAYAPALQSFAAGPAPSEEVALDQLDERLVAQVPEPVAPPEPTPEMVEAQKGQEKKSEARRERIGAIQPFVGKISDEQRRIEADSIAQVQADPDAAVAAYRALPKTKGGRIVNTDEARELFSAYNSGPAGRSAHAVSVHEASSAVAKEVLQENLEAPSTSNDPTVFFTGGGTGAGKSTAVGRHDETAALQDKADFIYDGNLHETKKAEKLFERARKSGRRSEVTYTIRDPLQAWTHGALTRANREDYGRTVPISIQADTHIGAAKTALELIEKYGLKSGGDVSLRLLYNSFVGKDNPANEVREGTVGDLRRIAAMDQKQLEDELYDALEVEFAEGRISERVYNGTRESSPEIVARGDSRKGRAQLSGPDAGNEGRAGGSEGPGLQAADSRGEGAPPSAGQSAPEGAGQGAPARVTEERPARKPDEVDALARKAESAGAPVVVVDDISELPEETRRELNDQGDVRAAYANGTIYIIRNRVTDQRALKRDLAHEVAHHVAGEWAMANALKIIDAARNAKSNPRTAAALRDVLASYDAGTLGAEGVADEIVAHMAEEYAGLTGRLRLLANELIAAIRKALRGFAADTPFGDREILAQLSKRLRAAQKAKPRPARALRGLEQESLKINTRGGERIQIVPTKGGWSAKWESGGESPVRPTPQDVMADVAREVEASGDVVAETSERREPTRERTLALAKRIGTRNPTAKQATENGVDSTLTVGVESMRQSPKQLGKNAELVNNYPGFRAVEGDAEAKITAFIDHVSDNLLWLYNKMAPSMRERAKLWYVGARAIADRMSVRYGKSPEAMAGAMAALSPQMDWFQNVSFAERVAEVVTDLRDTAFTPRMELASKKVIANDGHRKVYELVRGKKYSELTSLDEKAMWVRLYDEAHNPRGYSIITPEGKVTGKTGSTKAGNPPMLRWGTFDAIANAIEIIEADGDIEVVSRALGAEHKVRNFYNNIIAPGANDGDVTIDTHAVAAALLRPLGGTAPEVIQNLGGGGASVSSITGTSGTYGIFADAYRKAAQVVGILPREMQSITWEAVRGLFSGPFKNSARARQVEQFWVQYSKGELSLDEARERTSEVADGIQDPDWSKDRDGNDAGEGWTSTYAGKLFADGDFRRADGAGRRGDRGDVPGMGQSAAPARAKRTGGDAVRQLRRADDGAVSGYFARGGAGNAGYPRVLGHAPLARFTPNERVVAALAEVGIAAQPIAELPPSANASYHGAISAAKAASAFGSSVYVYPVDDYAAMRLFVVGDGSAGFALKGDDIVSVFSDGSSKGVAHSMLLLATQEGGRRLDAFNTVLPEIYAAHGFRTAAKLPWNDEFAPEDWSKGTYAKFNAGEPDVVFMAYDHAFMGAADTDAVDYAPDYDAAVAAQQALLGRPARAKRTGALVEPPTRPTNVREPLEFLYERASRYGTESPALPSVLMGGLDEIEWGFTGMPARRAIEGGLASLPQDVKVGFNRAMRAIEDESARTARDARPRAKRYAPTGPRPDDLISLDGSPHWGEIDAAFLSEVKSNAKIVKGGLITLSVNGRPQKMSVPAPGKIVVKVGTHGPDPASPSKTKGFGLAHIDGSHGAELRAAGYEPELFVEEVIKGFDEVWLQPDGRLVLMKNKAGSKPMVMIVELRKEQGVWNVVGAFIASSDWRQRQTGKGHRLIWDGRNSPSRKAAQSQGVRNFPSLGSGSPGTPTQAQGLLPQRDQVAPTPPGNPGTAAVTPNPAEAGLSNTLSTSETGPTATIPQTGALAKRKAPNFSDATLPSTNFMRQLREHNSSLVPRLWEAAKAGGRKLRLLMQDRFLPVAWVQDLIIESGGNIDDSGNTYQRESVYYGRVGNMIRLLKKDMIEPLFKRMAELNVPVEDLELYLYARFAPDRNAKIASINPKIPEGGSGMTDEDAAQVMADFASAGMTAKLAELAKMIDKMNAARIDLLERYGLLSPEEAAEWRAEPNYVPLKGIAEGTQDEEAPTRLSTGKGFSVGGREAFRAMGRKSRATDILANTIAQVQQAIVRSERNRIMQSFLSLVLGNPNPDMWEIARIKMKPVRDVATGEYAINQDFNTAFVAERETHSSPDIVTVKVKGKQYAIRIKDQRLADAIKNAGTAQLGPVLATLASVGRALSLTRTTLAPEFMVANFARDIQTAIVNLSAEDSLAMARAVVRDIGPALRGVYRTEREKSRKTDWQQYYEEFLQAGGKTDFVAPKSVEELAKELRSMAQKAKSPSSIGQQFKRFTLDWIMAANGSIENAVRLSAYVNGRRRGLSEQQAASVAKNLTVNFNRKGQLGPAFNALYMFFNASVQGSARFIQVMANPQTRRFALGFAASTATLGYVLAELARAMAGDDDDGESLWEKMPNWEKSRNVILFLPEALVGPSEELQASLQDGSAPDWMKSMVGILPGGGAYLKLPMPYVYNVFYLMGQAASDVRHGKSAYQGAGMIAHALATSFNPFGDADSGSLAKFVAPTVLDPVIDVEQNRNFFGAPIRPVDNPFDKVKEPDSAKYFESTNPIAIWVAKALNEATGGTELRKGAVDVSPTTMEYAFNFVTGGTGAFIDRAVTFVSKVASGEDVPISKVPFLRVVYGEPSERRAADTYYRVREDAAMRIEEVDLLRETSQGRQLSEEEREASTVAGKLKPALNASERAMRGLRKQRKIVKASETMTAAEKEAKVKQIDEAILAAQLAFNTVYFGAVDAPQSVQ